MGCGGWIDSGSYFRRSWRCHTASCFASRFRGSCMSRSQRLLTAISLTLAAFAAQAQGTIKIGEINSYKVQPGFLEPYKKGMELAVEQVNAAGGVNGRKLELLTR